MAPSPILYDHFATDRHTLDAPRAVLALICAEWQPTSLLDVGCGLGTWVKVAMERGIHDVLGIDGVPITEDQRLIPSRCFSVVDFRQHWDLKRRFDLLLCLEVAEHLEEERADAFIRCLTRHADRILFSAAAPGQVGQHHVNCRWPSYWQAIFNKNGFSCEDSIRWRVWNEQRVEPWYRQNMFIASKNPQEAGGETRLQPVVHPEFVFGLDYQKGEDVRFNSNAAIEGGEMTIGWYLRVPVKGVTAKIARRVRKLSGDVWRVH